MNKAKTLKLSLLLVLCSINFINAQFDIDFGIKGGVNFGSMGELRAVSLSKGTNLEPGYHIGVFGKLKFGKFYLRPELVYTKRQNNYSITLPEEEEKVKLSSIDFPMLLGVKIIKPLSIFAGPSFHYILDQSINSPGELDIIAIENDLMVGINIGIAIDVSKFGIDLRYEKSFGKNLASFQSNIVTSFGGTVDTRSEQIILSLSYKIF